MNVEELSQLTEAELRARANVSLQNVETMSAMDRQHRLVEAQFYIDEIERREQAAEREEHGRIAERDYNLEIWVIALIGIEIVLSIVGLVTGYIEGAKQTAVLDALKNSVDTLNTSTTRTAENIASLTNAQNSALNTQRESLTTTSSINSAMQDQLEILREDQRQRNAELAKVPSLRLLSGGIPLNSVGNRPVFEKEISSVDATYEFVLINVGDATARTFHVYVGTDNKDVKLTSDNMFEPMLLPSDAELRSAIDFPVPVLSASGRTALILKVGYPAGTKTITLHFWANGENIPNMSLGDLTVHPPVFPRP